MRTFALNCYLCGGKGCKYENWSLYDNNAIEGLYSNWINEDIVAMQRPSTRLMTEFGLVAKFQELGIGSIFNLQEPGEHAVCGDGLTTPTGFSYNFDDWTSAGINVVNCGWLDMSIPDIEMMLSLAQIMACQIREGKKIAIHCHAGLGRTGLAIVCYMIYEKRMGSDEAIQLVRKRRPGSVQNKKQTAFAQNFEKFVESLRVYYPPVCLPSPMALSDVLNNQSLYLFGGEQQKLKWVPKVVHLLVSKIKGSLVPGSDQDVLHHFARFDPSDYQKNLEFIEIQIAVNQGDWKSLEAVTDVKLLVQLLLHFFVRVKPMFTNEMVYDLHHWDSNDLDQFIGLNMDLEQFITLNSILEVLRQVQTHNVQPALNRLAFLISQQDAESPSSRLLAGFKSLAIWKTSAMVAPNGDLPHHPLTTTEKLQELLKFMMDSYEMSEGDTVLAVIPKKDRPVLTPKSSKLLKL